MNRKELGEKGEEAAVKFLKKKKYKILERNVRLPLGEIDIVAKKDETIVFVEVKAGSNDSDFSPIHHYDNRKQHKQIQLAHSYLSKKPKQNGRFDLILVHKNGDHFNLEHFENVIQDEPL